MYMNYRISDDLQRRLVGVIFVSVLLPPIFEIFVSLAQLLRSPMVCI